MAAGAVRSAARIARYNTPQVEYIPASAERDITPDVTSTIENVRVARATRAGVGADTRLRIQLEGALGSGTSRPDDAHALVEDALKRMLERLREHAAAQPELSQSLAHTSEQTKALARLAEGQSLSSRELRQAAERLVQLQSTASATGTDAGATHDAARTADALEEINRRDREKFAAEQEERDHQLARERRQNAEAKRDRERQTNGRFGKGAAEDGEPKKSFAAKLATGDFQGMRADMLGAALSAVGLEDLGEHIDEFLKERGEAKDEAESNGAGPSGKPGRLRSAANRLKGRLGGQRGEGGAEAGEASDDDALPTERRSVGSASTALSLPAPPPRGGATGAAVPLPVAGGVSSSATLPGTGVVPDPVPVGPTSAVAARSPAGLSRVAATVPAASAPAPAGGGALRNRMTGRPLRGGPPRRVGDVGTAPRLPKPTGDKVQDRINKLEWLVIKQEQKVLRKLGKTLERVSKALPVGGLMGSLMGGLMGRGRLGRLGALIGMGGPLDEFGGWGSDRGTGRDNRRPGTRGGRMRQFMSTALQGLRGAVSGLIATGVAGARRVGGMLPGGHRGTRVPDGPDRGRSTARSRVGNAAAKVGRVVSRGAAGAVAAGGTLLGLSSLGGTPALTTVPDVPDTPHAPDVPRPSTSARVAEAATKGRGATSVVSSVGKGALRAARVIPVAGQVLAAGMAAYDGITGWNRAGQNFGLAEGQEATVGQKAASSAGAIASGLTFGLLGEDTAARGIHKAASIATAPARAIASLFGFGNDTGAEPASTTERAATKRSDDPWFWFQNKPDKAGTGSSEDAPEASGASSAAAVAGSALSASVRGLDALPLTEHGTIVPPPPGKAIYRTTGTALWPVAGAGAGAASAAKDSGSGADGRAAKASRVTGQALSSAAVAAGSALSTSVGGLGTLPLTDQGTIVPPPPGQAIYRATGPALWPMGGDVGTRPTGTPRKDDETVTVASDKHEKTAVPKDATKDIGKIAGYTAAGLLGTSGGLLGARASNLLSGVVDGVRDAWGTAVATARAAPAMVRGAVVDYGRSAAQRVQSAVRHITGSSDFEADGELGRVSAKYESGGRGVSTVSTGVGDAGGVSYGKHQLASSTGTMQAFLDSPEGAAFRAAFAGQRAGSDAFSDTYRRIAASDGDAFAQAQQSYITRTHFNPVERYARENGLDTSNPAIREALYSQSVQHGFSGNKRIINDALQRVGGDASDTESFIDALYNARGAYASQFASAAATTDRYARERQDILAIARDAAEGAESGAGSGLTTSTPIPTLGITDEAVAAARAVATPRDRSTASRATGWIGETLAPTSNATPQVVSTAPVASAAQPPAPQPRPAYSRSTGWIGNGLTSPTLTSSLVAHNGSTGALDLAAASGATPSSLVEAGRKLLNGTGLSGLVGSRELQSLMRPAALAPNNRGVLDQIGSALGIDLRSAATGGPSSSADALTSKVGSFTRMSGPALASQLFNGDTAGGISSQLGGALLSGGTVSDGMKRAAGTLFDGLLGASAGRSGAPSMASAVQGIMGKLGLNSGAVSGAVSQATQTLKQASGIPLGGLTGLGSQLGAKLAAVPASIASALPTFSNLTGAGDAQLGGAFDSAASLGSALVGGSSFDTSVNMPPALKDSALRSDTLLGRGSGGSSPAGDNPLTARPGSSASTSRAARARPSKGGSQRNGQKGGGSSFHVDDYGIAVMNSILFD